MFNTVYDLNLFGQKQIDRLLVILNSSYCGASLRPYSGKYCIYEPN